MTVSYQDLLQQLTALGNDYPELGRRLVKGAEALQNQGIPLSESLIKELLSYQQTFTHLQQQALEIGKFPPSTGELSFTQLEDLLKSAIAKDSKPSIHPQALEILKRVLAIAHREQSNFASLDAVQKQAKQLYQTISESNTTDPIAEALVEKKHPLSALLRLIEEQDNLSDEEWANLEDSVTSAFGKTLTVAISRGKLTINTTTIATPIIEVSEVSIPPEVQVSLPVIPTQTSGDLLPEVIIIPGNTEAKKPNINPDIRILEAPSPGEPLHEVIIVPSVEVSQPRPTIESPNIVLGSLRVPPLKTTPEKIGLKILVHLQGIGDRVFGPEEYAGTKGQSRRLEALEMRIDPPIAGLNLKYMAHVSGIGDTPWLNEGELAGARGQAKRIEGFAVQLTGPESSKYEVFYNAHIQNIGDTPVLSHGQYCGTRGRGLRVEGIKVWIQPVDLE
jgi:Clostridial hydrophobic W